MNKFPKFKERLKKGERLLGTFIQIPCSENIEIFGYSGFDFVILDCEHGHNVSSKILELVRASETSGVAPFIRVPKIELSLISNTLDTGCSGIVIPNVKTAEEAALAVKYSKYGPEGIRGVCPYVRAGGYGALNAKEYYTAANNETVVCIMLESEEAIGNLSEILDVKGIDVVLVGPADLSTSMNIPGGIEDPRVQEKIQYIVEECKKKQISSGVFAISFEYMKKHFEMGANFIPYSIDDTILFEICKKIVSEVK